MHDRAKVIKDLEDIQKHLDAGYSFPICWKSKLIRDTLSLLKEQDNEIDTLKTLLLGYETGAIEGNNDAINQNRRLYVDG